MYKAKDILIGVLIAYVALDIVLAYMLEKDNKSLLDKVMSSLDNRKTLYALAIAAVVGVIASMVSAGKLRM